VERTPLNNDSVEIEGECALAMAQAVIDRAIKECGIPEAEIQEECMADLTKVRQGGHDLTFREFGRIMRACGLEYSFEAKGAKSDDRQLS
jgi:hypothetical protein